MSPRTLIVAVIVFVAAGFGMFSMIATEPDRQRSKSCASYCEAQGKRAVVPPSGTAGRSVEHGSTWDWRYSEESKCQCVGSQ
jgi:hypothetical protein